MRLIFVIVICYFVCEQYSEGSLDVLSHYEILEHLDLNHRITKRSIEDDSAIAKDVEFDAFGRHFHLKLKQQTQVVSREFRVVAVDGDGNEREVTPRVNNIYHGYDMEKPEGTKVTAYFEDDYTMTAKIITETETYLVEPAWRHLENNATNMIAYKRSDLDMEKDFGTKYCEGIKVEAPSGGEDHDEDIHDEDPAEAHSRVKRQILTTQSFTPNQNTCPLYLVADYRFFEYMGDNNIQKTISYLLGLIDQIDQIYRNTELSYGYVGMGFEVKEIKIHEYPSTVTGGGLYYNMARDSWDTKQLLEVFSRTKEFKHFCLAHLFTHLAFDNGVLGLAYIGSPRLHSVGGICSPAYYKNTHQLYLNTGWSSSLNRYKRRLLTEEALLVTAHEFGHNWGSEHDPDTDECSPNAFNGGKYIMYTYSVSGYDSNNKIFSNCTRRNIGAVIHSKSASCFEAMSGSFCGNFRIEQDEECDGGANGRLGLDPCCDEYCRLKSNAVCCDSNHDCCFRCQYLGSENVCHEEQPDSCQGKSTCNGNSGVCPVPSNRPNNTTCINRGKCRNGKCLSFCESEGLFSCVCDNATQSCHWCCKSSSHGICTPHPKNIFLPNGTSCLTGYCEDGVCKEQKQDLIQRLWDIIENITPDKVVQFMRANIVGTVIVFSLVIWIPASCFVCHKDRQKKKQQENHRKWMSKTNSSLLLKEKSKGWGHRVKHAEGVRTRRPQQQPMQLYIPQDPPRIYKATVI